MFLSPPELEYYYEKHELVGKKMNPYRGWEIYPQIMFDMAIRMKEEYGNIAWFIAENGMGVENECRFKIEFISEHLKGLLNAIIRSRNLFYGRSKRRNVQDSH